MALSVVLGRGGGSLAVDRAVVMAGVQLFWGCWVGWWWRRWCGDGGRIHASGLDTALPPAILATTATLLWHHCSFHSFILFLSRPTPQDLRKLDEHRAVTKQIMQQEQSLYDKYFETLSHAER